MKVGDYFLEFGGRAQLWLEQPPCYVPDKAEN